MTCKQLIQLIFYQFYIFSNNDRFSAIVVTWKTLKNKEMENFVQCLLGKLEKYGHCRNEDTENYILTIVQWLFVRAFVSLILHSQKIKK